MPKYLDNADLLEEIRKCQDRQARNPDWTLAQCVSDRLARMFVLLVEKFSRHRDWRDWSYREDLQAHAVMELTRNALKFDSSKSRNAFGYCSRIAHNAFKNFQRRELRQTRAQMILMGRDPMAEQLKQPVEAVVQDTNLALAPTEVQVPLPKIAEEIGARIDLAEKALIKADDHRLAAALLVAEAKKRIDAGEAGGLKWGKWSRKHINRSRRDINRLLKIGTSENPQEELARQREGRRRADAKRLADQSKSGTRPCPEGAEGEQQAAEAPAAANDNSPGADPWDAAWSAFNSLDSEEQRQFIERAAKHIGYGPLQFPGFMERRSA